MLSIFYIGNDKWATQFFNLYNNERCSIKGVLAPPNSDDIESFCAYRNVPLIQKENANQAYKEIKALKPDLIFIFGHPFLLKERMLSICNVIGFHPSLLPQRRGRAPLNWAIIDGLKESGVTLFLADKGVDNGKTLYQEKFKIEPKDTAQSLICKINDTLVGMVNRLISAYPNLPTKRQDESKATYTPKRTPKDSEITLDMTAE